MPQITTHEPRRQSRFWARFMKATPQIRADITEALREVEEDEARASEAEAPPVAVETAPAPSPYTSTRGRKPHAESLTYATLVEMHKLLESDHDFVARKSNDEIAAYIKAQTGVPVTEVYVGQAKRTLYRERLEAQFGGKRLALWRCAVCNNKPKRGVAWSDLGLFCSQRCAGIGKHFGITYEL